MEQITQNNKLLAEFMGAKYNKDVSFNIEKNDLWLPKHGICNFQLASTGKRLKYHCDWNWLMEVLEKIEAIENNRFEVEIRKNYCEIYDTLDDNSLIDEIGDSKIDVLCKSCIKFVKWWNRFNKSCKGAL